MWRAGRGGPSSHWPCWSGPSLYGPLGMWPVVIRGTGEQHARVRAIGEVACHRTGHGGAAHHCSGCGRGGNNKVKEEVNAVFFLILSFLKKILTISFLSQSNGGGQERRAREYATASGTDNGTTQHGGEWGHLPSSRSSPRRAQANEGPSQGRQRGDVGLGTFARGRCRGNIGPGTSARGRQPGDVSLGR